MTLTAPTSPLRGPVTLTVTVRPATGLTAVELLIDGQVSGRSETAPWSLHLDSTAIADGSHALAARAHDGSGHIDSAPITVVVDNGGFRETFAGGADDNPGWTRDMGWAVNTTEDHTSAAGSAALVGEAVASNALPVRVVASISVEVQPGASLRYHRKIELGGDAQFFTAAFRVRAAGLLAEEITTTSDPVVDADWVETTLDLGGASGPIELRFELSASSWSWGSDAVAKAVIDDIVIEGASSPPPANPPPTNPPPTNPPPANGAAYEHASELMNDLAEAMDITGNLGVTLAGGHLIASDARGGSSLPRTTPVGTADTIQIPAGATVRHALLWYTGVIFMRPYSAGEGDYTPDVGGPLDDLSDVQGNGISFSIGSERFGPFDPGGRQPPNQSSLGSEGHISPRSYAPSFGTLTGVKESVWGNRLDVTGLFAGKSGALTINVDPPEKLDVNGNDASRNGGNPAGNTTHNLCTSGASWSLLVIYEKADLPVKNLVLMDGPWSRAWDYMFFHSGLWHRPKVRIDHAPIQLGAKLYVYAGSGSPVGHGLPTSPACSCGCGGEYTLKTSPGPFGRNDYYSDQLEDPQQCTSDPMHRDRTNGPWYLHSTGQPGIAGNDWTLFQSGARFTELPNVFEGESAPSADNVEPVTNEDEPDSSRDTYAGHPWGGRAQVIYHGHGNANSTVELAFEDNRITPGETTSYVYFKGDQKDVWKPQQIVSVKYILLETPVQ